MNNLLDLFNMLIHETRPILRHYRLGMDYLEMEADMLNVLYTKKQATKLLNLALSRIFTKLHKLTKVIKDYPLDEQRGLLEQYDRIVRTARTSIMVPWYTFRPAPEWTERAISKHTNLHLRRAVYLLRQIRKELRNKCTP